MDFECKEDKRLLERTNSSSVICSCHFTEDSFEDSLKHYQSFSIKKKRKLKPNAVPTIFKMPVETGV